MQFATCLSLVVQLTLVFNSVTANKEFNMLKADPPKIEGRQDCDPVCTTILGNGVRYFQNITHHLETLSTVSMFFIGDVPPFRNCRMYGADTIRPDSHKCVTNSDKTVFDHEWQFTWTNLSVVCDVNVHKSPAKMVSILTQATKARLDICGTKVPFDQRPYNRVDCPSDDQSDDKATATMTARLGEITIRGLISADNVKNFTYPHDGTITLRERHPIRVTGVPSGYESSVKCLRANTETIVRQLMRGFHGSVYPCPMGIDSTYSALKTLGQLAWGCVQLPPLEQLLQPNLLQSPNKQ